MIKENIPTHFIRLVLLGLCLCFSQTTHAQFDDTREEALAEYNQLRQTFNDGMGAYKKKDYATAYTLLLSWAEDGDVTAQSLTAYMYANGLGVSKNSPKAWHWQLAAAKTYKKSGKYVEAVQLLQPYMKIKSIDAHIEYWSLLALAGTEDERRQGIALIKKYAESGNAHAQHEMGTTVYMVGGMTPERWIEKVEWLKLSAGQGYAAGQYAYGQTFSSGKQKNKQTLLEWVKKAADQGHPDASYEIGMEHAKGERSELSESKAYKYFNQAAKNGHLDAKMELGHAYQFGRGVTKNTAKAISEYRRVYFMAGFGTPLYFEAKKELSKLESL